MSTRLSLLTGTAALALLVSTPAFAAPGGSSDSAPGRADELAAYWTPARQKAAQPRELVLDGNGHAFLRSGNGNLRPYGSGTAYHGNAELTAANAPATPMARPGGGGGGGTSDRVGPTVSSLNPGGGDQITASHTFLANVVDPSGVRSVTFVIVYPNGQTISFAADKANDTYSKTIQGFTNGAWQWYVVAKDNAAKGGNTTTTPRVSFTVNTGSGGGGTGATANAPWGGGGAVQTAAGRLYFEMPGNGGQPTGYVCSGTAVTDSSAVSIILTAAHCVYDDVEKVFASNVMFIPNQDATTGTGTDGNCANDPLGCWAPSHGVVDLDWTTRTFPNNIPWDYAYYVVPAAGAHAGTGNTESLEAAAGTLSVQFAVPITGSVTHALGYSYSDDPDFMYCAEAMQNLDAANWWLPSCDLSGGSSGGPWVQPMDVSTGAGPVISVNSWGYTNQPGMAGPKLFGTSASCVFNAAQSGATPVSGGVVAPGC